MTVYGLQDVKFCLVLPEHWNNTFQKSLSENPCTLAYSADFSEAACAIAKGFWKAAPNQMYRFGKAATPENFMQIL
jgi:hypothetical protein